MGMTRRRERRMRIEFNRACRATRLLTLTLTRDRNGLEWRRQRATSDQVRANVALWMGHTWIQWLLARDPDVLARLTVASKWPDPAPTLPELADSLRGLS